MRGRAEEQVPLFHTFSVEDRIRPDQPLRDVKRRVERMLASTSPKFAAAYGTQGRPSVPPERLSKALLPLTLHSIRSERQLCERIDVSLLFRRFLDLQPGDDAFDPTTFSKNRKRLDEHDLTKTFFDAVVAEAIAADLCSEHFSVDGTLIESFASAKSFQPNDAPNDAPNDDSDDDANGFKPRNVEVDFHGRKRTNDTPASRTDPEAKLYRKSFGREAKLSHMGHTPAENRHGLIVNITVTAANGTAERTAALDLPGEAKATHKVTAKTVGADKGYDAGEWFQALKSRGIVPHVPPVKRPRDPATVANTGSRRDNG